MIASLLFNKQLTTNALLKLSAELGGRAATFLLLLLAARRLTTADFGSYNYALARSHHQRRAGQLGCLWGLRQPILLETAV